jgi:hypothetical protein
MIQDEALIPIKFPGTEPALLACVHTPIRIEFPDSDTKIEVQSSSIVAMPNENPVRVRTIRNGEILEEVTLPWPDPPVRKAAKRRSRRAARSSGEVRG